MNENKKCYYIYSCIAVVFGMGLLAFFAWLVYDFILKLAQQDFSNNTVVQALITLVITVFIGGYFSKWLEQRNYKKIELYKIQSEISINTINLATSLYYNPDNEKIKQLLIAESSKIKLYFSDELLKRINEFIAADSDKKCQHYDPIIDELKKCLK